MIQDSSILTSPSLLKVFLIVSGLFWGMPSFGQPYIDLLRIEYSGSLGNDFKSGSGTSDVHEWVADVTAPVGLSPENTLLTGFLYEHVQVSLYADQPPVRVSTFNLKLGLNHIYSDTWSASYLLLPKYASDLKQYRSEDFQIGAAALLKYTKRKNFHFKFGAFFNTDRFGHFITPLLGLYYQREKWEANLLIPRIVDINYRVTPLFRLGLRCNGSIRSFQLNEHLNGIPQYLSAAGNDIGVYMGWSLGRIYFVGTLSRSVGRHYRSYAQGDQIDLGISLLKLGDDRRQLNYDFKDGLVFKIAILYRLELEEQ